MSDTIQCSQCGKFIAYDDLESGAATLSNYVPDNHFDGEQIEFLCPRCNAVDDKIAVALRRSRGLLRWLTRNNRLAIIARVNAGLNRPFLVPSRCTGG